MQRVHESVISALNEGRIAAIHFEKLIILNEASNVEAERLIDEAARQAALLASDGAVIARDGSRVALRFDTICIHADMDGAVERLRAVRRALER